VNEVEKALRNELNVIPELYNKIFPTHAPENKKAPYLVYFLSRYEPLKTLNGFKNYYEASYLLNILASSYEEMKDLTKKVGDVVSTFLKRNIGEGRIYVSDLSLRKAPETFEHELQLYRGIWEVTVWYKEV
jgi:hypothetical protein